jgi:transcription termination factor Rho
MSSTDTPVRRRTRTESTGRQPANRAENQPDDRPEFPVTGIVEVLDNHGFLRTRGYQPEPEDVYLAAGLIKRYGLRSGDEVTGAARDVTGADEGNGNQNRRSARKDKYNPLVRVDTINGMDPEKARNRPNFYDLTALYPQERLHLSTEPRELTGRVVDLVMPIGKGQRALIVSPPKAGKTTVLQTVANAIARNNPEVHLMMVLIDERPEEVTDMQRSVKAEVVSSTFDRPPQDHMSVSELAIERAKRLVELGRDVVVVLDSLTRLGRAYNLGAKVSGRTLSGGIDSTALYPPKRFLGAARNIENGGSLTIIASALVETGSVGDTLIFEEFKSTGNAELKLDRKTADKRVFPAIDIEASGTRREEILLAPDELAVVRKLRRALHALDGTQAIEQLVDQLRRTGSNTEFLMYVARSGS